jgi:hypothetical protein
MKQQDSKEKKPRRSFKIPTSGRKKLEINTPHKKYILQNKALKNSSKATNLESILPNIILHKNNFIKGDLFIEDQKKHLKEKKQKELQSVLNKSETIINKLRKLYDKAKIYNDKDSVEDIEYIISKINDQNLYDIDKNDINNNNQSSGIEYLMQYSSAADSKNMEKVYENMEKNNHGVSNKIFTNYAKKRQSTIGIPLSFNKNLQDRKNSILTKTDLEKLQNVSENLLNNQILLIDSPMFDIFSLNDIQRENTSIVIATEILNRLEYTIKVDENIINNFIKTIANGYDKINAIYHNDLHAADVMQTLYTIFQKGGIIQKMHCIPIDPFSMLIAAFCHDLHHTGQNNVYHINSRSKIATRYNDISVLENYHVSSSFKIMSKPETNIMKDFTQDEYRIMRKRMIRGILSTDMSNHQKVLTNIKNYASEFNIQNGKNFESIFNKNELKNNFEHQQNFFDFFLHCSDISNAAKPNKTSIIWTQKVYAEFFKQGDLEKEQKLPVSLLCDRDTTDINKAMVGFISFVIKPTFEILINIVPEIRMYRENLNKNLIFYQQGNYENNEEESEEEEESSNSEEIKEEANEN